MLQLNGILGLAGRQWMFIIRGLLACLLGIVVPRMLADTSRKRDG